MAPQWMPHDIQKRLLKYILEQLSLFSKIDLANIDVSLGTKTQVNLKDVIIDVDKFSVPGAYLRDGTIDNLDLALTVSDGVAVNCDGLHITVSPSTNKNSTSTPSNKKFSLTKSTVDLAKSTTFDDYVEDSIDEDDLVQSIEKSIMNPPDTDEQPPTNGSSTLNSVMQKAAEYALSKLSLNFTNIYITIVADPLTAELYIANASFSSDGQTKKSKFGGIEIRKVSFEPTSSHSSNEEEKEEEEEEEDSYDDQLMATSFMSASKADIHKSLVQSMMQSQDPSSAEFMTAQTEFFNAASNFDVKEPEAPTKKLTRIAYIDKLEMSWDGLQSLKDVEIRLGTIKIAAAPIPDTLESLSTYLSQVRRLATNAMRSFSKQSTDSDVQEDEGESMLDNLTIGKILVDLESNLLEDGNFASNGPRISLSDISLELKSLHYYYGSIANICIGRNGDDSILHITKKKTEDPDMEFEIQAGALTHFVSTISPTMNLCLNVDDFAPIYNYMHKVLKSVASLGNGSPQKSFNEYILRILGLTVNISLAQSEKLSLTFSPITVGNSGVLLSIDSINGWYENQEQKIQIGSVVKTELCECYLSRQICVDYDSIGNHRCHFKTAMKMEIREISINAELSLINRLSAFYNHINQQISSFPADSMPKKPSRVRIANSLFIPKATNIDFSLRINAINVVVKQINKEFGDVTVHVFDIGICKFPNGSITVSVGDMRGLRQKNKLREVFISKTDSDVDDLPLIFLRLHNEVTIYMRCLALRYYGSWLTMFEDAGGEEAIEEEANKALVQEANTQSDKKFTNVTVLLFDTVIYLMPIHLKSEAALYVKKVNVHLTVDSHGAVTGQSSLSSVPFFLIDDTKNLKGANEIKRYIDKSQAGWTVPSYLKGEGYVNIGTCNTMLLHFKVGSSKTILAALSLPSAYKKYHPLVDLKLDIDSFMLGVCADSCRCFVQFVQDLKEPVFFTFEQRYKTQVEGVETYTDIDNGFFGYKQKKYSKPKSQEEDTDKESATSNPLHIVEGFYDSSKSGSDSGVTSQKPSMTRSISDSGSLEVSDSLKSDPTLIPLSFSLSIQEVTVYLYDGYDWEETRTQISRVVVGIQHDAEILEAKKNDGNDESSRDESGDLIVGQMMYESIHIGARPGESLQQICNNISKSIHQGSETSLNDTINLGAKKMPAKNLRLKRSHRYKAHIIIKSLDIMTLLISDSDPRPTERPPIYGKHLDEEEFHDSELVGRIGIRIGDFKIIDNVPSSSWNMLLGYMREAGDRELGSNMIQIDIDNVRPVSQLAATELRMKVSVLPLRMYVDQDTLDFLMRFSEFSDKRFTWTDPADEILFLERVIIDSVRVKLDYKPKQVDYAGLRSGHTDEFMNFFNLEDSNLILRKIKAHGIAGFSRLHQLLSASWTPDIKRHQLGGVLAGVGPLKSLVKIAGGFRDLIAVPVKEYRTNGNLIRGIQKSSASFGRITGEEAMRLGVKIVAGTQTILENTEAAFGGAGSSARFAGSRSAKVVTSRRSSIRDSFDDTDERITDYCCGTDLKEGDRVDSGAILEGNEFGDISDSEALSSESDELNDDAKSLGAEPPLSLYANQPESWNAGLQVAYKSLQSNIQSAKAALASANERASTKNGQGAAIEYVKAAPVMLIRPLIGTTEAISRTLLGGMNNLDPEEKKRSEEKYKQRK